MDDVVNSGGSTPFQLPSERMSRGVLSRLGGVFYRSPQLTYSLLAGTAGIYLLIFFGYPLLGILKLAFDGPYLSGGVSRSRGPLPQKLLCHLSERRIRHAVHSASRISHGRSSFEGQREMAEDSNGLYPPPLLDLRPCADLRLDGPFGKERNDQRHRSSR